MWNPVGRAAQYRLAHEYVTRGRRKGDKRIPIPKRIVLLVSCLIKPKKRYYAFVTEAAIPGLTLENALTFSTLCHVRSITHRQFTSPFFPGKRIMQASLFLPGWKGRPGFSVISFPLLVELLKASPDSHFTRKQSPVTAVALVCDWIPINLRLFISPWTQSSEGMPACTDTRVDYLS